MENDKTMCTFQLEKHELEALDTMAKKSKLTRSEMIRVLLFMQMDQDVSDWLIPLAVEKGIPPWQYMNIILRTFKQRCFDLADKQMVLTGS